MDSFRATSDGSMVRDFRLHQSRANVVAGHREFGRAQQRQQRCAGGIAMHQRGENGAIWEHLPLLNLHLAVIEVDEKGSEAAAAPWATA